MLNMILVGLMGWTTLSIVVGIAAGGALRYCGRRDGLVPVRREMLRKSAA